MNNDKLDTALNITSPEIEIPKLTPNVTTDIVMTSAITTNNKEESIRDYEAVRDNLHDLIEATKTAVEGILQLAQEGEEPRAYEVVADMVRTSLEANSKLMELHKTIKDIKKESSPGNVKNVTNNSIYVGNTNDLLKMLKGKMPVPESMNLIDEKQSTE